VLKVALIEQAPPPVKAAAQIDIAPGTKLGDGIARHISNTICLGKQIFDGPQSQGAATAKKELRLVTVIVPALVRFCHDFYLLILDEFFPGHRDLVEKARGLF
jgi:hypothetical protein